MTMIASRTRGIVRGAALLIALAGIPACGGSSTGPEPVPIEEVDFAPSLGVELSAMTKTASGLYYLDESVGTGAEAAIGDMVLVHYTGWLPNGTQFDTSLDGDGPLDFELGASGPISGFQEGTLGMRVDGQRLLAIPYYLAYGAVEFQGVIPAYSSLVFRIQLVDVIADGET